ncbi:MAG: polysaccharide biosynthesis/export family protein [Vicinamibacterales bacterium]
MVGTALRSTVLVGMMMAAAFPALAQAVYRVGTGDILRITVWSQPDLSGQFTIDAAGGLSLPLIGTVPAAGKTVEELESVVRDRLADGYLTNPQVAVAVAEYRSQRIFVVGEVKTPGAVPLTGTLSLVEALTRVGSLSEFAGGELVVIRPPEGKEVTGPTLANEDGAAEVLRVDVRELLAKGPRSNVDLRNGDTVVVPRSEVVYVIGQITSPGAYPYERDMTVMQVIARANGINDLGTTRRLKIQRVEGGKRVELKVSVNDKVMPGDTIVVASRWF